MHQLDIFLSEPRSWTGKIAPAYNYDGGGGKTHNFPCRILDMKVAGFAVRCRQLCLISNGAVASLYPCQSGGLLSVAL